MEEQLKALLNLCEMRQELMRNVENSRMREQDESIRMYLNGLFRHPESKPLIYNNAVPEIYVLHHYTTISLAWYIEDDDTYIDRQAGKRIKFDANTILGWCYKAELFPQITLH